MSLKSLNAMKLFLIKLNAFFIHLLISGIIIGSFFALVFFIWYPSPYQYLEGVEQVTFIILLVDLILGPIMTFILYRPGKKGLVGDIILIALIQSGAFFYGATVIYGERPVYITFSYDQFKSVLAKNLDFSAIQDKTISNSFFKGPQYVNIKLPQSQQKRREILSEKQAIYEMTQLYQAFAPNFQSATKNTKGISLKKLLNKYPEESGTIQQIKNKYQPKKRSSPCNDIISSTKLLIIELFFSRLE
ncbi:MAG: hypothetical protein KZQ56_11090, partial [gamma proteobacterium symbiont of Lucinoma myriamae]|nr:hypothetical protein [gamma proteobacterium symbiont of Lucinoma myriamae]